MAGKSDVKGKPHEEGVFICLFLLFDNHFPHQSARFVAVRFAHLSYLLTRQSLRFDNV